MKSLALLGGRAKDVGPHDEIWSLNACYRYLPESVTKRCTRWFELHRREWLERGYTRGTEGGKSFADHARSLDALNIPVYQWERWPEIRQSILYPREFVNNWTPHGTYHCGSFDWMVALAITERQFSSIHFYGMRIGPLDSEPISARPALEYWLGVAEGQGITVTTGDSPSLFATYQLVHSYDQYGYHNVDNVIYADD